METLFLWLHLFGGLLLSGICVQSSFAFPSTHHHRRYALYQTPQLTQSQGLQHTLHREQKGEAEEREKVHTVRVTCHPDSMEIFIKADMFGVGAPVDSDDLRLGVEDDDHCRATASLEDEYRIAVGLVDCGTKHWMTEDSLVYTNLLIFSPVTSPYGLIRLDEAVVPIECHYERKYSLSSSSLKPAWIPFTSTQAAEETLMFDLRIMTPDWLYKRGSNVFYLGESISIEASVQDGSHMGLRVFVSNCVATLNPDVYSAPRYVFLENGCLVDSRLPGSKSHFIFRKEEDKLQLVIDTFRFHNEDNGELYITCQLNAIPVNYAEASNKACTLVNRRWQSADGNDYLCRYCQSQSLASPRGFGRPDKQEALWRSGLKTNNVWEQEARVGPLLVLPAQHKSGLLPVEEVPPVSHKLGRPVLYSSQWRSGVTHRVDGVGKSLPSLPDLVEDDEDENEMDLKCEELFFPLRHLSKYVFKERSLMLIFKPRSREGTTFWSGIYSRPGGGEG
uniref:Zona pellucida sperm-binding protein 3 n=1 Tax=Anabas testudineus TaxID=64144 RepID=A0A7N6BEV0_ANATE